MAGFNWTAQKLKAAHLTAEDTMSRARIAEECGIAVPTLAKWRNEPDFQDRVREIVQELDEAVSQLRFAKRRERIRALDEMASDMVRIRDERSAAFASAGVTVTDPETGESIFVPNEELQNVPGGKTGRIIKRTKVIGTGANQQQIIEYEYDKALDASFRETLTHIAKERGEWSDGRREISGPNGTPLLPIIEIEVAVPSGYGDSDDDE